jgi:hypothetical protein
MISGRSYFALINGASNTPALTAGKVNVTEKFTVNQTELKSYVEATQVVGTAGYLTVTFAGTYAVGDIVRLTVTSSLTSRQLFRKTYTHVVQAGLSTVTDIAVAFKAMILADKNNVNNSPYSDATNVSGVLTITQYDDDSKGLVGYTFTDSASGTIVNVPTATVISEGQPSDLEDRGIAAADITIANYTTLRITLHTEVAIPFIDSQGATARELFWYGTPAQATALKALFL